MEFTGLAKAVSGIRMALISVRHLSADNFTPRLTSLCRNIQQQDKTSPLGERGVFLSTDGHLLEGFRLNKENTLADVLTSPLQYSIDRETKRAVLQFPKLAPGINIHLPWKQPAFRFIIGLGTAIDISYQQGRYNTPDLSQCPFVRLNTGWYTAGSPVDAQSLEVQLGIPGPLADFQTLVLAVGIEMGGRIGPATRKP